jgi:hypothetical protein
MVDMVPAHSAVTVCQDSWISRSAAMAASSLCHKVIQSCASLRGSGISAAVRSRGFASLNPVPPGRPEVWPAAVWPVDVRPEGSGPAESGPEEAEPEELRPAVLGPAASRPPGSFPALSKPASIVMLHSYSSQAGS